MYSWKELEHEFCQLTQTLYDSRIDVQWGDGGEHWRIAGGADTYARQRFELLAHIAGEKLLQSSIIAQYQSICSKSDPVYRWIKGLQHVGRNLHYKFTAQTLDNEGNVIGHIHTGSIDRIAEASSLLCLKLQGTNEETIESTKSQNNKAIFNGPVFGGVQIGGSQNVQNIANHTADEINNILEKMLEHLYSSSLPELEKEDAIEAVKRISELVKKEPSSGVLERIGLKLKQVTSIVQQSKELASLTAPLLDAINNFFK